MKYSSLRQGLVGAWVSSLGPTGNTLLDRSGYGNHGTLTNMDAGTDWVASRYGWALDFDGTDDQVLAGTLQSFSFIQNTHVWMWSGWVKFTSLSVAQIFCGTTPFASAEKGFAVMFETGRGIGTQVIRAGVTRGDGVTANTYQFRSSDNSITTTDWHHVCVGMNGPGTNFVYINGMQQSTTVLQSGTSLSSGDSTRVLGIGYAPFSSIITPMAGQMDDIRIYSQPKTPSEIRLLATEPGIGLKPEPTSVFFGAELFNAAWARNSNNLITAGVI